VQPTTDGVVAAERSKSDSSDNCLRPRLNLDNDFLLLTSSTDLEEVRHTALTSAVMALQISSFLAAVTVSENFPKRWW
jgi:hypothetical protein